MKIPTEKEIRASIIRKFPEYSEEQIEEIYQSLKTLAEIAIEVVLNEENKEKLDL
jgi:hypothetical protein